MEKKKLLLVAVSVGVFLTIVIGAAILVFSPKSSGSNAPGGSVTIRNWPLHGNRTPTETAALTPAEPIAVGTGAQAAVAETPADSRPAPFSIDAADIVRNGSDIQNIQTPPSATAIQETYFYINGVPPTEAYHIETRDGDGTARVTINFPPPVQPVAATAPNTPENRSAGTTHTTPIENRPAANPAALPAQPATANPVAPSVQPAATAKPAAPPVQPTATAPAAPSAQPATANPVASPAQPIAAPPTQPAATARPAAPPAQPVAAPAVQPVATAKPAAQPTAATPPAPPAATATPPAQPTAAAKPAAPPTQPATAKPAASAKPAEQTPAPAQTKTYTDYWVQTGAFSAKANADGVKETLAARGITSIIENRNVNGKTLYQVRVGPYTSENEAKYWLALVQSIDGFSESQIRQTSSVR